MAFEPGKLLDYFNLAFVNFSHRKTRTMLTLVGIFIGIAAVIALISIGQGLQVAINGEFARIGANKLILVPGQSGVTFTSGLASALLKDADVKAFRTVTGIDEVSPIIYRSSQLEFSGLQKDAFVAGVPVTYENKPAWEFLDINVVEGEPLSSESSSKVMIGSAIADGTFFEKKVKVGDSVKIDGRQFKVSGVLKRTGDPSSDNGVMVSLDNAKILYPTAGYSYVIASVDSGLTPKSLIEKVKKKLRNLRNVKEGEEDFAVQTTDQIIESFNSILGLVQAIVVGIAAISLFVGGINIMNTMYTSVLERTREIGVMKSIGARNGDILAIFLIESGLLGLAGGLLGVIVGVILAKLVEVVATVGLGTNLLVPQFDLGLIFGSLMFSFLIGSISGALPARRASMQKPLEAIRYE